MIDVVNDDGNESWLMDGDGSAMLSLGGGACNELESDKWSFRLLRGRIRDGKRRNTDAHDTSTKPSQTTFVLCKVQLFNMVRPNNRLTIVSFFGN